MQKSLYRNFILMIEFKNFHKTTGKFIYDSYKKKCKFKNLFNKSKDKLQINDLKKV